MRTEDRRDRIIDRNRKQIASLEQWVRNLISENERQEARIQSLEKAMFC